MKNNVLNRAKLFKKLHGLAKEIYGLSDPHPLLHQLAVAECEVISMSELTEEQLELLIGKVTESNVNWNKVEALGVTRIPQMSIKQQGLVKNLQKELGWSDEYMYELTIQRYGYLDWQYLTGKSAWSFCNYLLIRAKSKKSKAKKMKEVA